MKKWMMSHKAVLLALFSLTTIILLYFLKLFYPQPSIYITPDLGLSDVLNLNYSLKDFLSASLKNHELPLWSKDLLNGFPVLAESQIGALNFLNLFLFYFFPSWLAFNLTYVISFLTAGLGMFFYLKSKQLSASASLLGALAFTFSGSLIFQISHPNLLQAISLIPLIFLFFDYFLKKPDFFSAGLLAFLLNQQFLFGFLQSTFITLIGLSLYLFLLFIKEYKAGQKQLLKKTAVFFVFTLILFFCLSSWQILPTQEYTAHSNRRFGIGALSLHFSFHPLMILTALNPYFFGSPKNGTFSPNFYNDGAVFWESIIYFGLVPLIFFILSFGFIKKIKNNSFFILLLLISFILMLGKYSPFYFIFTFFPFSNFRETARYGVLFIFSLTILATFGFENFFYWLKKKVNNQRLILLVKYSLLFLTVIDLFFISYNYQPTEPLKQALALPETALFLKKISGSKRIFPFGGDYVYQKKFINEGFKDINLYKYYRNDLNADLNLLYKIPSSQGFFGSTFFILKKNIVKELIEKELLVRGEILKPLSFKHLSDEFLLSLLRIYGADYVVSPLKIEVKNLKPVFVSSRYKNEKPYRIYQVKDPLPRIVFLKNFRVLTTLESSLNKMAEKDFDPKTEVILAKNPDFNSLNLTSAPAETKIIEDKNQYLKIKVKTKKPTILLLNETDYPGWQAYLDNKKTEIYTANIIAKAIIVNKGSHLIEFKFRPKSFIIGSLISLITLLFIIFQSAFRIFSFFLHKEKNKTERFFYP